MENNVRDNSPFLSILYLKGTPYIVRDDWARSAIADIQSEIGVLGALAYADTASGSASIPIASSIVFNPIKPNVTKGSLSVSTSTGTLNVASTEDTAIGKFSPAAITIPAVSVAITPSTNTFTALSDVTYDENTKTLSISTNTSDSFWTGYTQANTVSTSVTPPQNQDISVKYQKVTPASITYIESASLDGDLSVSSSTPTATITDPTVQFTVTPDSD